jgi:hypothetical protein
LKRKDIIPNVRHQKLVFYAYDILKGKHEMSIELTDFEIDVMLRLLKKNKILKRLYRKIVFKKEIFEDRRTLKGAKEDGF